MAPSDLDPTLFARPLRDEERRARTSGRNVDAKLERTVRPRIAAHVSACRQALDAVETELDRLVETLSINPAEETRPAALWLLMGRCVGLQRAVLLLAEHGMAAEGRPLDRTIKETTNLVRAMAAEGPTAEKVARRWLADGQSYVKAQAGRRAMALPTQDPVKDEEAFKHLGLSSLSAADRKVYDDLSRAAHGRRSSLLESYYSPTRQMARGTRYALLDCARTVDWASCMTSTVVLAACTMLVPFHGQDYVLTNVISLNEAIDAIRDSQPLDPDAIAHEAGLVRYPHWPAD